MNISKRVLGVAVVGFAAATLAACAMLMGTGAEKPAESEFGLGPRVSMHGTYTATLQPVAPLAKRKLQRVRVAITDANGAAVEGAAITVDGGMPQHGHGLPTKPRVTKSLGNGVYEIEGVRFNMGGWWVFELAIAAGAGADTVTFNLAL